MIGLLKILYKPFMPIKYTSKLLHKLLLSYFYIINAQSCYQEIK